MSEQIIKDYLSDTAECFGAQKKLAERALAQIRDEDFFRAIDSEANSPAAVVKHIGGNLRSRWTDFLTSDGEKPDRDRDSEFVTDEDTRESVINVWNAGWTALLDTLEHLSVEDLDKPVTIRGENYTVVRALNRALAHAAQHIGQIIFLAKHFRSSDWETLSVPKNKSAQFNQYLSENKDKAHYLDATRDFAEKK
jgi:hypothetical protein